MKWEPRANKQCKDLHGGALSQPPPLIQSADPQALQEPLMETCKDASMFCVSSSEAACPDYINDYLPRVHQHTGYIGEKRPALEKTGDLRYLWRPASGRSLPAKYKHEYVGGIGWGIPMFDFINKTRRESGFHIKYAEPGHDAVARISHRYQNPWQPTPGFMDMQGKFSRASIAWHMGDYEDIDQRECKYAVLLRQRRASLPRASRLPRLPEQLKKKVESADVFLGRIAAKRCYISGHCIKEALVFESLLARRGCEGSRVCRWGRGRAVRSRGHLSRGCDSDSLTSHPPPTSPWPPAKQGKRRNVVRPQRREAGGSLRPPPPAVRPPRAVSAVAAAPRARGGRGVLPFAAIKSQLRSGAQSPPAAGLREWHNMHSWAGGLPLSFWNGRCAVCPGARGLSVKRSAYVSCSLKGHSLLRRGQQKA
ncbi:PREDICTED: uncharacterized protein C4orf45 homolog [Condylura cristata]|uniref:uncharacterized protein C4orf45 homolog n=1 Tax=Condylura cristata TaxID=143302 RepID=UPI0003346D70|nr:PREDICTED: uncharacterized protein C4orf45 homolog [Condylura cristata]